MDWSDIIRALEKQGLTLTEIGTHVGLSVSSLSDLKNGRTREPTGMAAVRLHAMWKRRAARLKHAAA